MNEKSYGFTYNAVECPECGTPFGKVELGICVCVNCGYQEETTLGKVRAYLQENTEATVSEVAKDLNLPVAKVSSYIRKGRIEIKESSESFLNCRTCQIPIRYGKFCPECASKLAAELASTLEEGEIGEVPEKYKSEKAKMRYLNELGRV